MSDYLQSPGQSLLGKKIILCGLSEAGKTAIRSVVYGGKEALEVRNLGATLNYVRQFISLKDDKQVTLMDLGGQRIFLDRFITKFSPFVFHNVATLVFVVDVFDPGRFDSSKHYFSAALERLHKYSPNAVAFVLLHKMDLVEDDPKKDDTLEYIRSLFQQDIETELVFFQTTIFNESIKEAMQAILEVAFPEVYRRSTSSPKPVTAQSQPKTITPSSSIAAAPPKATSGASVSSTPTPPPALVAADQLPIAELVRAFSFIEDPSEPLPTKSDDSIQSPSATETPIQHTEDISDVVKAFRFIETGALDTTQPPIVEESTIVPDTSVNQPEINPIEDKIEDIEVTIEHTEPIPETPETPETPEIPEIPEILETPEIPEPVEGDGTELPDVIIPITDGSRSHVSEDIQETDEEIQEEGSIPETISQPPVSSTTQELPQTVFDSHSTLDDEFDIFEAAEEVVRYLDSIKRFFNLSYVAVKMNDEENLVQVGEMEVFDDLANQGMEQATQNREQDPTQISTNLSKDNLFIIVNFLGESLALITIGKSELEASFQSIITEFTTQVTKMVEVTFSDIF